MTAAFSLLDAGAFEKPKPPLAAWLTLEDLVERHDLGALPISPAQRALCQAADGRPVRHLNPERIKFHFGYAENDNASRFVIAPVDKDPAAPWGLEFKPPQRPKTVVLETGVRAAKSLIAALGLVMSALTCQFRREPEHPDERPGPDGLVGVRPGELVRALIVAPVMSLSRAPFHHLKGALKASPILSKHVVPGKDLEQSILLRRDDGQTVLVEMVAASAAGTNLRSTWLAGILFDEADFHDVDGAAIDLKTQIRSVRTRILPGGQIWVVSSPWDDSSQYHQLVVDSFGKAFAPGHPMASTLVFHSDSLSMNPSLDRAEIAAERARDPENAAREYDAVPLPSSSTMFFPKAAIDASMAHGRDTNLAPNDAPHWFGSDLGYRKNSSALAGARWFFGHAVLAYHEERVPPKGGSLSPSEINEDFAKIALSYDASTIQGDGIYRSDVEDDFAKIEDEKGRKIAYEVVSSKEADAALAKLKRRMLDGTAKLTADPVLRKQLEDTRFKSTTNKEVRIVLPARGRAHGDVLMAVALAMAQVPDADPGKRGPVAAPVPETAQEQSRYSPDNGGDGHWFRAALSLLNRIAALAWPRRQAC